MGTAAHILDHAALGELQAAFSRKRAAWGAMVDAMCAAGAFRAPDHLAPGLQGHLVLEAAMPLDQAVAEAA